MKKVIKDFNAADIENMLKGKLSLDDLDEVAGGNYWDLTDEELALFAEDGVDDQQASNFAAGIRLYKKYGYTLDQFLAAADDGRVNEYKDRNIAIFSKYWDRIN